MLSLKSLVWGLLLMQPCHANQAIQRLTQARLDREHQVAALLVQQDSATNGDSTGTYRYKTAKTTPYLVTSMPNFTFPLGELYGGSVAINASDPSRKLFFMFKPSQGKPVDEITIWLNGGPGCSSLTGFLEENGPYLWQPGVAEPVQNKLGWSQLTNVLWVEQPVGTGFSQGKVTATNEVDVAEDFVGFFKNFETLFGIKNYKIYITGESYAGRYVPYISAQMLDLNNTEYFDLKGALMYDPCIGDCGIIQNNLPLGLFAQNNNEILNLDPTTMSKLQNASDQCGYTAYLNKYLTYPPPGYQPPPPNTAPGSCNFYDMLDNAAQKVNPCFNVYHITDYCPTLPSSVGYPGVKSSPYFNRADVKAAIHAPQDVEWSVCASNPVFVNDQDNSEDSIIKVLPQVIEATNRVLVANGNWDALIPNNGTLLAIQNMTWNGKTGFQTAPTQLFSVPTLNGQPAQGVLGTKHNERGLQWLTTAGSGHMQPQYQPAASFRHLQWLLGRIPSL